MARKAIVTAKNEYLINNLYLSDTIAEIIFDIVDDMGDYVFDIRMYNEEDNEAKVLLKKQMHESERNLHIAIAKLRKHMQEELAIGYYERA